MEELLDFSSNDDPNLNNFINATLNSRDNADIFIKIDDSAAENHRDKPSEIKESWSFKSIRATQLQKKETVEETLRLRTLRTPETLRKPETLAIRFFYKKFHPEEFDAHEKFNNWSTAKITEDYIRKWVKSYLQAEEKRKKIQMEKIEIEKMKTQEEIEQESAYNNQFKEFMEKPIVKITLTSHEKEKIIFRIGENIKLIFVCFHFMLIFFISKVIFLYHSIHLNKFFNRFF